MVYIVFDGISKSIYFIYIVCMYIVYTLYMWKQIYTLFLHKVHANDWELCLLWIVEPYHS